MAFATDAVSVAPPVAGLSQQSVMPNLIHDDPGSQYEPNIIAQDIANGHGVFFLDPHGDAIEDLTKHIPKERKDDVSGVRGATGYGQEVDYSTSCRC
jgi:hypothetical protein